MKYMVSLFRHLSLAMAVFLTAGCAFEPRWYSEIQKSRIACETGDFAMSEDHLAKALSHVKEGANPDYRPPGVGSWRGDEPMGLSGQLAALADSYLARDKTDRAASLLKQSTELAERDLARLHKIQNGNSDAAEKNAGKESELQYELEHIDKKSFDLQHNLFKLGDLYVTLKDFDNAEAAYTKGLNVLERIPPSYLDHALMYIEPSRYLEDNFAHVGEFYYKQGKLDPARNCFTRALSIGETPSKEDASNEEHSKAIQHYKDTLQQIEAHSGK